MSSVFDQGPPQPCPQPFNMAAHVLAAGIATPDKTALETIGKAPMTLNYAQLRARVASTATGLLHAGLRPGDRLMLRVGNRLEFPLAYLASIWAGIVPVPTSAQLTQGEVDHLATACTPAAALTENGIAAPTGVRSITCDALGKMRELPAAAPQMGDPNRLAYIVFTSGTSGVPRGVCHAHRAIWARRMMYHGWYGLGAGDRLLHAGAFNWTYTLGTGLMDPWAVGATALIPADGTPPQALPDMISGAGATIFAAAPGVYRKVLPQVRGPFPALRHGLSAGEHLSEAIRTDWQARTGTGLHQALGMSECSTFISSCPDRPAAPDTSGRPQPGRRVAVLQDGLPAPFDTPGELAVGTRDPGLMLGYLDAPQIAGDWFATGDMARMSGDGTITYLGRGDDMMNAGGYRVSPLEVEGCFAGADGLTGCAAVQVTVKADATVIALFHTGAADEAGLRAHAEQKLARYKQPRLYIRRATLPYGANGKLNRRALRDSYEAPDDCHHSA